MAASAHDPASDVPLAVRPLTVSEYHRLAEAGILDCDERVELLDGQLIQMAPIGPEHQFVLDRLNRILTRQENEAYSVGPGRPISIPEHDEPQPDLVVYRPSAESRLAHTTPGDVLLVVEISDTTLHKDNGPKRRLYEAARIPEYWIVELPNRRIRVLRLGEKGRYHEQVLNRGELSPVMLPGVKIQLDDLLG